MKIMHCPLNGPRNISEFVCGGDVRREPAGDCSDREWAEHVFLHANQPGVAQEWWLHVPTALWFIADRDIVADRILRTYPAAEVFGRPGGAANTGGGPA
jgi:sarcosine oxidase subunit delta